MGEEVIVGPVDGRIVLSRLARRLLDAVEFDAREFIAPDGSFQRVRDIPRPLSLLLGGVKMKRLMPVEWADVMGLPAAEVVELKWEPQARLLLRAIEVMTRAVEREKGAPLTDDEVDAGALGYVAQHYPEVAAAHPEVFGGKKP